MISKEMGGKGTEVEVWLGGWIYTIAADTVP